MNDGGLWLNIAQLVRLAYLPHGFATVYFIHYKLMICILYKHKFVTSMHAYSNIIRIYIHTHLHMLIGIKKGIAFGLEVKKCQELQNHFGYFVY